MGRFTELTKIPYGPNVSEHQEANRRRLPELLAQSSFQTDTDPTHCQSKSLLIIGAATYSNYDMHLLDSIEPRIREIDPEYLTVAVFDIGACQSPEVVNQFIPGTGNVPMTPAIGLWVDGQLVTTANGYQARQFVEQFISAEVGLQPFRQSMKALNRESVAAA